MTAMKAVIYRHYGSPAVLLYEEVDRPVPRDDQVLLEVRAASVNPLDWHFVRGEPYPFRSRHDRPKNGDVARIFREPRFSAAIGKLGYVPIFATRAQTKMGT
jgi:hypothetical protein